MKIEDVSAVVVAKTKQLNTEIVSYFTKINNYLQQKQIKMSAITSIDEYKQHFGLKDVALATLVQRLVAAIKAKQVVDFGQGMPNFDYGQNSVLIKEPCNCAMNPISVQDKKIVRASAERYLKLYSKHAGDFLTGKDVTIKTTTVKRSLTPRQGLTRRYLP